MPQPPNADQGETLAAAETTTSEAVGTVYAMRRQPCPCGSGKKFKNCHEGKAGYAVAAEATVDETSTTTVELSARAARGGPSIKPHFPGKQAKNIASQKDFHAHYFRRG